MQKFSKKDKQNFDKLFKNKEKESEIEKSFYKKTEKYLRFVSWVPWLKMIWIWNSISMNSAKKDSDIDLFIVSDKNRMWLVRGLVTLIFQVLWVRKTAKNHAWRFCLSFFCELEWLDFSNFALEKDPYLYFWILYFKPILDYDNTYKLFLEKNSSWADFSDFQDILENNKTYIKYTKNIKKSNNILKKTWDLLNYLFKKILLPKTKKHYNKIWKPYGIIINDKMLKFHDNDIRKKVVKNMNI